MTIELEILQASQAEHFKYAKELSMYLPVEHPKRIAAEKEHNKIIKQIDKINKQ